MTFWENPPQNFQPPLLRQIRVESARGLRGIQRLVVPFSFPFTAICGRNGVGKSTVLALAALSAKAPVGWQVHWGNTRPRTTPNARPEYGFADFFPQRHGDAPHDGLKIEWISMMGGNETGFAQIRRNGRFVQVRDAGRLPANSRRPARHIDFVPISRVVPAAEHGAMRSAFGRVGQALNVPLSHDFVDRLSYVMGRQYQEGASHVFRGMGLPMCRAGERYSGFDMGAGESSVIVLLLRLEAMPLGGLLLIEELELGLHSEAQARLVEVLIGICWQKRLQIICTTHSEIVLDSLPRQARVLIRKSGADHEAVGNVSTRSAIHDMSGDVQPELVVYTEDTFAANLIQESLSSAQRLRVAIRDIGSNATLARQAVSHERLNGMTKAISFFDGDCTEHNINGWINGERGERVDLQPNWRRLPADGLTPERWIARELVGDEYCANLASELNCTILEARAHVAAIQVQAEHHDIGFEISRRTGIDADQCNRSMARAVCRTHPAFNPIREAIQAQLDHH